MKNNKKKILITLIILMTLLLAFWYGGDAPGLRGWKISDSNENTNEVEVVDKEKKSDDKIIEDNIPEEKTDEVEEDILLKDKDEKKQDDEGLSENTKDLEKKQADKNEKKEYSKSQGMEIDKKTGKDKYQTDPVPEGKPVPVEPENVEITDEIGYCTLTVRADTILDNMDWLNPEKVELVPEDGVIYETKTVKFYKGESVFNVLLREMKQAKIHMEFVNTPMYNSAYIQGINNLYEFDCGELSGWMYRVNGWFPNYGASRYLIEDGDVIEWLYTCDLGKDIGGDNSLGGD